MKHQNIEKVKILEINDEISLLLHVHVVDLQFFEGPLCMLVDTSMTHTKFRIAAE